MTKKFILISSIYLIAVLVGCLNTNAWIIGACLIILVLYPIYKINYLKSCSYSPLVQSHIDNLKHLRKNVKHLSRN
jgi:hypothetical protein